MHAMQEANGAGRHHAANVAWSILSVVAFVSVLDVTTVEASCGSGHQHLLPLKLGNVVQHSLGPSCIQEFVLSHDSLRGTPCDPTASSHGYSFLHFELWNLAELDNSFSGSPAPATSSEPRADPLLVVARNVSAMATYQESSERWTFVEVGSGRPLSSAAAAADWPSYKLLKPYQRLLRPAGTGGGDWRATVQNVNLWLSSNLTYAVRARCVTEPQCQVSHPPPSNSSVNLPAGADQPCGGKERGICRVSDAACATGASDCALCECARGWGDTGCAVRLSGLGNGQNVESAAVLDAGDWHYYELQVDGPGGELLVELTRSSGDPVLFVKPAHAGFQPGSLPTVLDYDDWADGVRFAERVNDHWLHLGNVTAGRYYVGVYNYDSYIQEGARYDLTARWTTPGRGSGRADDPSSLALCPKDCSGHGSCSPGSGECKCDEGRGGAGCEFEVAKVEYGVAHEGALQPGQWAFFKMELKDTQADRVFWADGLVLQFKAAGGHPVLLAAHGRLPSLASNDILFSWRKLWTGEQRFYVKGADLQPGTWVVGVMNMDYYVHDAFEYTLAVDSASFAGGMLSPYWSVGLGVSASLFLCALFSIFRRIVWERHEARMGQNGAQGGPNGRNAPRGVPREIIESFPARAYKPPSAASCHGSGEASTGGGSSSGAGCMDVSQGGARDVDAGSEAEPACTVCLCEYEEDELIRGLPCGHEFHLKCIDLWLSSHSTCPICRFSVVPPDTPTFEASANAGNVAAAAGDPRAAANDGVAAAMAAPAAAAAAAAVRPMGSAGSRGPSSVAIELLEVGVARQPSTNATTTASASASTTIALASTSTRSTWHTQSHEPGGSGLLRTSPAPPLASPLTSPSPQRLQWRGFGARGRAHHGTEADAVPLTSGREEGVGGPPLPVGSSHDAVENRVTRRISVVDRFTNMFSAQDRFAALFGSQGGFVRMAQSMRGSAGTNGSSQGAQQLPPNSSV